MESMIFMARINNTKPVCLHVSRRDLVSSPLYSKLIRALSIDYYESAIQYILSKLQYPTFFEFSDDLEWCRRNLYFYRDVVFVEDILAGKKAEGHFYLMSQCKHFITSNSTFAWWASYLSNGHGKLVIYIKDWCLDLSLKSLKFVLKIGLLFNFVLLFEG